MGQYDALLARSIDSAENWTSILTQLPNPHPLQSWAWGELKSRWGWQMRPTVWEMNGEPLAAAMLLRRPIPRTPLAAMLYAPKGPVLDYENADLRRVILERMQLMGRSEKAVLVKIDPDVVEATGATEIVPTQNGQAVRADLQVRGWQFSAEQIQFRNTVTLDLAQSEEAILQQMKQKTRYNIRLAERRDVTIRIGTPNDFAQIASLYVQTSERNQFAIRPKAYYLDVWNTFYTAGMLQLMIAEFEGAPLAAVILVHNHDTALYMYGASTNVERKRMPTYLLQWEAIKWAKAHGCRVYDFWGAPDQFEEDDRMWGVWKFKRGFNATVARHIGAWDFPVHQTTYKAFNDLLPRYRNRLRRQA